MRHSITALALTLSLSPAFGLGARSSVQIGYGLQLNSMLNTLLDSNLQKQIFNQSAQPLAGQSAGVDYRTNWSASASDGFSAYSLVSLPELRLASEWTLPTMRFGIFGAISGIVPQTSAYYLGAMQLNENVTTCPAVSYANCPLAAVGFVNASGNAVYDAEIRSHMRFYNLTGGFSVGKKLGNVFKGDLTVAAELGLNVQSFAVSTAFAAARCTNATAAPCAQVAQSRVVQGEMKTQSAYALGPVIGINLRYDRPRSAWFIETAIVTTFLFSQVENSGYTNFVAGGTVAFSQPTSALGVEAVQNNFAVLPAVMIRFGWYL